MAVSAADIKRKHNENMKLARWIAERKEELFIASKDRVSDSIKESAWRDILRKCIEDGQTWTKGRDWAYLRDNKWVMVKSSVKRYLAGNGPPKQPQLSYIKELTSFVQEADILEPLKDKSGKLGGSITIKAETDITDQFRTPEILSSSDFQYEEPMNDVDGPAVEPFMTLSEALNSVQGMPVNTQSPSNDESLVELQKQALRAAIARDEALTAAANQVKRYYEDRMRYENGYS
ncbi:hypothetical protein QR680_015798 [Steinernema hermaphroditum]|uniref:Regulatory protein zeste n=1 Tax=Steinernema hermaphroditum TaxID=289476 RepID=A0AA39LL76_9BILA|nr:hypothetical protein QR680_015798 [Steinernema hermaphroditum]